MPMQSHVLALLCAFEAKRRQIGLEQQKWWNKGDNPTISSDTTPQLLPVPEQPLAP